MAFNIKKAAARVAIRLTSESYIDGPFQLTRARTPTREEIAEAIVGVLEAYQKSQLQDAEKKLSDVFKKVPKGDIKLSKDFVKKVGKAAADLTEKRKIR